jgi:hypothetical protein
MSETIGHIANSSVRSLAEAIILQSIEDLWSPQCKRDSLRFFEGDEFTLWSDIAGIGYVKQIVVIRMLADAGFEFGYPNPGQGRTKQTARQEAEGVAK